MTTDDGPDLYIKTIEMIAHALSDEFDTASVTTETRQDGRTLIIFEWMTEPEADPPVWKRLELIGWSLTDISGEVNADVQFHDVDWQSLEP